MKNLNEQRILSVISASNPRPLSLADQKSENRAKAIVQRKAAVLAAGKDASDLFTANMVKLALDLITETGMGSATIIAGYWPMASELDVVPALLKLGDDQGADQGVRCCLPVVIEKDAPLIFRQWTPGCDMEEGGFGTSHPAPVMAELTPDIIMVPLLAFDARGYRLGWGGGFYDRTLQALRSRSKKVVAVGVAYGGQEIETVVRDKFDQPVDWIVTEQNSRAVVS